MLRHGLRLALPEDFGLRARRYRRGDSWPRRPEASIPGGQRQARRIVHRGGAGTLRGVGGRGRRAECSRRIMRNDHIFSSLIEWQEGGVSALKKWLSTRSDVVFTPDLSISTMFSYFVNGFFYWKVSLNQTNPYKSSISKIKLPMCTEKITPTAFIHHPFSPSPPFPWQRGELAFWPAFERGWCWGLVARGFAEVVVGLMRCENVQQKATLMWWFCLTDMLNMYIIYIMYIRISWVIHILLYYLYVDLEKTQSINSLELLPK